MNTTTPCTPPDNEEERLRVVRSYEILDTPPELDFDALARLACHSFQTPIAVVALMDANRLWFKSKIGLDIPQLDRKIAFCSHTVLRPDFPLVIPDLAEDRRFLFNPLVCEDPHLRFYAGCPIVDKAGFVLGTVAVLDTTPRSFTDAQAEALRDVATLAYTAIRSRMLLLEMHRISQSDHLTGIPNRASFDHELVTHFSAAVRNGETFCLMTLDLEGFERVNDTRGRHAGDDVLREVARRLSSTLRASERLFRLSGDEFSILMPRADRAAAAKLAARIAASIKPSITLTSGHRVQVTPVFGTAQYTADVRSPASLLTLADHDLANAKRALQAQIVSTRSS